MDIISSLVSYHNSKTVCYKYYEIIELLEKKIRKLTVINIFFYTIKTGLLKNEMLSIYIGNIQNKLPK